MAEERLIQVGENSPEYVALRLFWLISGLDAEKAKLKDRKAILDAYAECIMTIREPQKRIAPR